MKFITAIFIVLSITSIVRAEDQGKPVSDNVKKQVLALLMASPAVRGAYAESKRWSGATKCGALQVEELSESSFKVYASCDNPGDPKEEEKAGVGLGATGQFHVSGQILSGAKPNSPISIVIESIEFTNAG